MAQVGIGTQDSGPTGSWEHLLAQSLPGLGRRGMHSVPPNSSSLPCRRAFRGLLQILFGASQAPSKGRIVGFWDLHAVTEHPSPRTGTVRAHVSAASSRRRTQPHLSRSHLGGRRRGWLVFRMVPQPE